MKILVDKMPDKKEECPYYFLYKKRDDSYYDGYVYTKHICKWYAHDNTSENNTIPCNEKTCNCPYFTENKKGVDISKKE